MVEEIRCVMCNNFPYEPKECKHCSKLFCKFCQLLLLHERVNDPNCEEKLHDPEMQVKMAKMTPAEREQFTRDLLKKQQEAFRKGQQGYEMQCPNCKAVGNFLWDVNNILQNCIDFCEFPHKCYKNSKYGELVWKTMKELQEHAIVDCPKFGCDICYHEDFQHMTR